MVNVNNNLSPEEAAEEAAWGMLNGRSIRKFDKFAYEQPPGSGVYLDFPVGTEYVGTVSELPKQYQAHDYETKEPKFYKDGSPIMEVSIVLDTPYRDTEDEEDDGKRIVRLGQNGKRALQDEMRRLGIKRFGIGTQLTMKFAGYKPNASGKGRPSKLYEIALVPAEYVPASQLAVEQTLAASTVDHTAAAAAAGFPQQVVVHGAPQPAQIISPPQVPQVPQVPQSPQPPTQIDPAILAAAQAAQAAAVPQPSAGIVVLQEHVDQVNLLVGQSGIPREVAIQAVANTIAAGNEAFRSALDEAVVI